MGNEKNLSNRAMGFREEAQLMKLNRAVGASIPGFADELQNFETFPIRLVNSSNANRLIVIHPGALANISEIATIVGVTADGIAKEGTVITDVTCSTDSGLLMEYAQRFINRNPQRITKIQFTASSEEQLNESLVVTTINPFRKDKQVKINAGAQKRSTDTNAKLVTITTNDLQWDDQTVVYVKLLAGATLSLNLTMGVCANQSAILKQQAGIFYSKNV